MSITFNLFGNMCENFNVFIRRKQSPQTSTNDILTELHRLITNERMDKRFLSNHILNRIVQMTKSQYGFIGRVADQTINGTLQPVLDTYAVTNTAWDSASYPFFAEHIQHPIRFTELDTYIGSCMTTHKPVIVHQYDTKRDKLPTGHPVIQRFVAIPCVIGGRVVSIIGLCNKKKKYTKKDIRNVLCILQPLTYLFITLDG